MTGGAHGAPGGQIPARPDLPATPVTTGPRRGGAWKGGVVLLICLVVGLASFGAGVLGALDVLDPEDGTSAPTTASATVLPTATPSIVPGPDDAPFSIVDLGPAGGSMPVGWRRYAASDGSFRVAGPGPVSMTATDDGWMIAFARRDVTPVIHIAVAEEIAPALAVPYTRHVVRRWVGERRFLDGPDRVRMGVAVGWQARAADERWTTVMRTTWWAGLLYSVAVTHARDDVDGRAQARGFAGSFQVRARVVAGPS